jgi:signal peptidase I
MTFKETWKKIWHFLTESNSVWSWIVDILLVFILVKFILLPAVGLLMGTSVPLVIVESGSMEHQGNFDTWFSWAGEWYVDNNISKDLVYSWKFNNGMDKGDIIAVKGLKDHNYELGDVIVFKVPEQGTPIIHRIISVETKDGVKIYTTKGDHNNGQLPYEHQIYDSQVLGKAVARVPKLGWVKLFFVDLFRAYKEVVLI